MPESQEDAGNAKASQPDYRRLRQEPVMLALLSTLAIVFFLGVTWLSHILRTQQEFLANRWFMRGTTDLQRNNFDRAIAEFRAALLYSRDNYVYQLNLAQALLGLKRGSEAYSYLINLWEREPENGLVNLELARIAAQQGETDRALRYYNNAIYATWFGDEDVQRRDTRLELIDYLLKINAQGQAQAELMALAANLQNEPEQQARVADLFLQAGDYEHALTEYRLSLREQPHAPAVLAGAGAAAFELGRYGLAERYLRAAMSANPNDASSATRLSAAELVMQLDPFQRGISAAQRSRIVEEDFAAAGQRINSCAAAADLKSADSSGASASSLPSLVANWAKLKPKITEQGLRRNPDLVENVMDLVFTIERETEHAGGRQGNTCGVPNATDAALLLIAKLHESS